MSKTYLSLKLDGLAHSEHTVSATQLINTLQGFVESILEANQVLNGHEAIKPDITIEAFNPGSFEALLVVEYTKQIVETVQNINPLEYIGYVAGAPVAHGVARSAIEILRRLKGKRSKPVESSDGDWSLEVENGEVIDVADSKLIELLDSPKFRKGIEKLFQDPLMYDGTDFVSVGVVDKTTKKRVPFSVQTVTQDEGNFFRAEAKGNTVKEDEEFIRTSVYFTKINFKSGKSWEIELPNQQSQKTELLDNIYFGQTLKRYNESKTSFSSDALFDVEIKIITKIDSHGVKSKPKYFITKVHKQLTKKEA